MRRAPQHRAPLPAENFVGTFYALGDLAYDGARVSASVLDLDTGRPLVAIDESVTLPIAGLGRVLPLIETAAMITERPRTALEIIDRVPEDGTDGPGLWRHLRVASLPVLDVALLAAAASDAVAVNSLLRELGLHSIRERAEAIGLRKTAVLDLVRERRGPDDAPHFALGSTAELAGLFRSLAHGAVVDAETSGRVLGWLAHGRDHSLVASAFGLDPLRADEERHSIVLVNATGASDGVRAEAGVLRGPRTAVAYAVVIDFEDAALRSRLRAIQALRAVGLDLLEFVH